jgi:DNA polymerase III subunit delta'
LSNRAEGADWMITIVGNNELVALLSRRGLPQSSLFAGPDGVGKKTLALALARLAQCKNESEDQACGRCSSCVKAASGNHPDIMLVEPVTGAIRIETMRRLSLEAQYRPFQGAKRFFIVDQAERMTEEASNSILKTLEEPPSTSHIVLVTAYPERLLSTIRSRCQIFSFHSLSRQEIEDYLTFNQIAGDRTLRAAFAGGSIGSALALDLESMIADRDRMLDLLTQWRRAESFETIYTRCEREPLRSDLKSRERVARYLEVLQNLAEDLYYLQVSTPERVVNRDRLQQLQDLSESLSLDWLRGFIYHVVQSRWEVDRYVNSLMCFDTLWLKSRSRRESGVGHSHGQI